MIKGLLGKKIGMSQVFNEAGTRTPVTILHMPKAIVVEVKNLDKDGYAAVKLGFGALDKKGQARASKPHLGQFGELAPQATLKEFQALKPENYAQIEKGAIFDLSLFQTGEKVDVSATSKGRGFQGVVKRHHFAGGPASHGHRFHRTGGSIGNRKFPGRVFKNKRMPGHMGDERVTMQNLTINKIDVENELLFLVGSVPGSNGSFIEVRKAVKV